MSSTENMDHMKRKHQSPQGKSKKLRNDSLPSMTSFENLSNELFLEIFDYLDGCVIYMAFTDLNERFHQLLYSSSLRYKIIPDHSQSKAILRTNYQQIMLHHRSQIFSIGSWMPLQINEFFTSFTFDSAFLNLESLALNQLEPDLLLLVLPKLSSLVRLGSLTIKMLDDLKDLTDVYRLIFVLPKLKYYRFTTCYHDVSITLPIATDKQFSTIEYLNIHHSYTFTELSAILSYTPRLHRLKLLHTVETDPTIGTLFPKTLLNFTCIFSHLNLVTFDQLETLLSNMNCQLQVLTLTTQSEDFTFLNADRWECILRQYFPQLKKFFLQCYVYVDGEDESPEYSGRSNPFSSSFWIERQWIFETKLNGGHFLYSILPYEKRWYEEDIAHDVIPSSIDLSKSAQLIVPFVPDDESYQAVIMEIEHTLQVSQIYHLDIIEMNVYIGILIELVDSLPDLQTLRINTLVTDVPDKLIDHELLTMDLMKVKTKIYKIYLAEVIDIDDVYFLLDLCPSIQYLKTDYLYNIEIAAFVRAVFSEMKTNGNDCLRCLSFKLPAADDQLIRQLEDVINDEQLLDNFTIRRVLEDVYIQWQ